jgi:hypothetical protein
MRNQVDTATGDLDLSGRHTWDPNPYFTAVGIAVIVSGWLASTSNDPWITGYVIYGGIAVFWIIVPNILSIAKTDMPFRTLFFTLRSLEYRLRFIVYIVAGGLAILFVHLAVYPWPDLARQPSVYAGVSPGHADEEAIGAIATVRQGLTPLQIVARERGIFQGRQAWMIYFGDKSGNPSGCYVRLTQDPTSTSAPEQVVPSKPCATFAS